MPVWSEATSKDVVLANLVTGKYLFFFAECGLQVCQEP